MQIINAENQYQLCIGRRGENLVTQVQFDISRWQEEFGVGTVQLLVQRPGDTMPYLAETIVEGSAVCWRITAGDTSASGYGCAELRYYAGERLAISQKYRFRVAETLDDTEETAPDPWQSWLSRVVEATGHYPRIGQGGNWEVWSVNAEAWTDSGAPARGEQGASGAQGPKGDKGDKGDTGAAGATGAQGPKGDKGDKGERGETGPKGDRGSTGPMGSQGAKGETGPTGPQGPRGSQGPKGDTPQRGVDYWTAADQAAIVSATIAALPKYDGGVS